MRQFVAAVPERTGWLAEVLPDLRDTLRGAQVWETPEVALLTAPLAALRHEPPARPVVLDEGRYALAGYVRLDDRARFARWLPGGRQLGDVHNNVVAVFAVQPAHQPSPLSAVISQHRIC